MVLHGKEPEPWVQEGGGTGLEREADLHAAGAAITL